MNRIMNAQTRLCSLLKNASSHIDVATADPRKVRSGSTSVWVKPPTITWENWSISSYEWTVYIVAGTPTTQQEALPTVYSVIEDWQDNEINIINAQPVTFNLDGAGDLAAYEITIPTIDN